MTSDILLGQPARAIVERLKSIPWEHLHVRAVVVHGSALWSRAPRDVDLLVVPDEGFSEKDEVKIMAAAEDATGLPADLHVVDPVDPDCFLVEEALTHGKPVYLPQRHVGDFVRIVLLCWDYMTIRRKLHYTEKVVRRALGLGGPRKAS